MTDKIAAGDRVRFQAVLSNGSFATWSAVVVRVDGAVALVRHPARARSFPFSPVKAPGLYRYLAANLTPARTPR